VDYLNLVAAKSGLEFTYTEPTDLPSLLTNTKTGDVNLVTSLTRTGEREQYLAFSKPYISIPAIIVQPIDHSDYTVQELSGLRVAVGRGYGVESFLQVKFPQIRLVPQPDDQSSLSALASGNVDAAVMDVASAAYLIRSLGITTVHLGGKVGFEYALSFATSKNNPELISTINQALEKISLEEKNALEAKWFGLEVDIRQSFWQVRAYRPWLVLAATLILANLVWIYILRKTVKVKTRQLQAVNLELEARVKDRTLQLEKTKSSLEQNLIALEWSQKETEQQLKELELLNQTMLGRETKMAELKEELVRLKNNHATKST
jgi:ABC-type amino acid transport substrate-binding protein